MKTDPDPEYLRSHLSEKARMIFSKALLQKRTKDTLSVLDLLNRNDVDYAVLKGISLSYFDRTREFGDLDILVDKDDVEMAADLLIRSFRYRYERPEELRMLKSPDPGKGHDISLVSEGRIPVEIHYRLFNHLSTPGLSLLADKSFLEMDGVRFACLNKELQLLEVLMHNVYHHLFLCDNEKWIRDMNIIIRNHPVDWDKFIEILAGLEQTELVHFTFWYLRREGKERLAVPPAVLARLRPASPLSYLKKPVFIWAGFFAWGRMFPPKDILAKRYDLDPASAFFLFAYPANWMMLVFALASMPFKR